MKNKTNKRAFTIVELVIVIAVIAVLAGVLIPTFSSLVKKAQTSKDTQLIRNLNTALAVDKATGNEHNTMTDALKAAKEAGYDVEKINASNTDNEILWDSVNDAFCYLEGKELASGSGNVKYLPEMKLETEKDQLKPYDYWKVYTGEKRNIVTNTNAQTFSIYLGGKDYTGNVDLQVGFDAGENTGITNVNYSNTSGNAKNVVIRTNGGKLTINDTNNASHQYHYGSATNVTVTTGTACYECHAIVAAMIINEGKVIAEKDSYIGVVEASATVLLEEKNGGVFVIPTNVEANKIPAAVASQIGYTNDGSNITANAEKAEKSYYVITKYDDLTNFVDKWNSGMFPGAANVKFAADVTIVLNEAEAWTPIGNWEFPFYGTFDGNGCVITGLIADSTHQNYNHIFAENASVGNGETYGFFGIVGGGDTVIKNLTLEDVTIDLSSAKNVGALIGYVPDNKKFKETTVTNKWNSNDLIGTNKVDINNVTVTGSVSADSHVSGLIGKIYSSGDITISNCHNKASITGKGGYIGGLVGIQSGDCKLFTINNCTNEGTITLTTSQHGIAGLIGRANNEVTKGSLVVVMTNCSNSGTIDNQHNCTAYGDLIYWNNIKSVTIDGVKVN